uniref:40S ribosomal protein S21 n=1 Tax=Alexandrium monilatum TaxID=311494 RepID=A0A7S4S2L7_9DINO
MAQGSGTRGSRDCPRATRDQKAAAMQNDEGKIVDLYLPRKCSATNRLIAAKEHGAVQLNVGQVDENGNYTGDFYTFALAGFIRSRGESDSCLNRLLHEKGLLTFSK